MVIKQIDPLNPCGGKENWKASKYKLGGTPGTTNSVYMENPDFSPPKLIRMNISNDTSVLLTFNEPMIHSEVLSTGNFQLVPDIGMPTSAEYHGNEYNKVKLEFSTPFDSSKSYSLHILSKISDCAGNTMSNEIDTLIEFPKYPDSTDIIINEVLFNALSGCSDYIELYNRSNKILNGADLLLSVIDGQSTKTVRVSAEGFLFYPDSYILLTESPDLLGNFYKLKNEYSLQKTPDLGSLNDYGAKIRLLNRDFKILDEVTYSVNMHLPTLKNTEGVSIERVSANNPSNIAENWHSAAETVGYGTPGYINSQFISDTVLNSEFTVENEIFSPDNDGYYDNLNIQYHFNSSGNRVSIIVFNVNGEKIRHLINNTSVETTGSFTWDGVSDDGKMCRPGMYLVFVRCIQSNGTVKEYKLPCVLAIKK